MARESSDEENTAAIAVTSQSDREENNTDEIPLTTYGINPSSPRGYETHRTFSSDDEPALELETEKRSRRKPDYFPSGEWTWQVKVMLANLV